MYCRLYSGARIRGWCGMPMGAILQRGPNVLGCRALKDFSASIMKKRSFLNSRILRSDRIYSAVDYGRANVIYVVTNTSVVVIDSTESPMTARVYFEAFRKICRLPVAYLIYTHFHGDHIARHMCFVSEIIAVKLCPSRQRHGKPAIGTNLPTTAFAPAGARLLSSPIKADRPVLSWAESLERMCRFRPEYLCLARQADTRLCGCRLGAPAVSPRLSGMRSRRKAWAW